MGVKSFWSFSYESQLTLFGKSKHSPSQIWTTQQNTKPWNNQGIERLSKMKNIIERGSKLKTWFPPKTYHVQPINPLLSPKWPATKNKCIECIQRSWIIKHSLPSNSHNTQNLCLPNFVTLKILSNLHHPPIIDFYSYC